MDGFCGLSFIDLFIVGVLGCFFVFVVVCLLLLLLLLFVFVVVVCSLLLLLFCKGESIVVCFVPFFSPYGICSYLGPLVYSLCFLWSPLSFCILRLRLLICYWLFFPVFPRSPFLLLLLPLSLCPSSPLLPLFSFSFSCPCLCAPRVLSFLSFLFLLFLYYHKDEIQEKGPK